jgi:hypothetical protein
MDVWLIIAGLACLVLVTQRWFWVLLFGISGLAACFALLASIIHFQILGALGFFFLMLICWVITGVIADGYS